MKRYAQLTTDLKTDFDELATDMPISNSRDARIGMSLG